MSRRSTTLAIAVVMMGGIFMLDFATGHGLDLGPLYLVPIGLASFVLGARYGYALALLAGLLLLASTRLHEHAFPTLSAFVGDCGTEATVYVVCIYVIGLLRLAVAGEDGKRPLDTPTWME
jgi:hypothetical protein